MLRNGTDCEAHAVLRRWKKQQHPMQALHGDCGLSSDMCQLSLSGSCACMRVCAQVTVTLQVEQSRRACDAVARGEADCAIIGGEVPDELADVLQVAPASLSSCTPCQIARLPSVAAAALTARESCAPCCVQAASFQPRSCHARSANSRAHSFCVSAFWGNLRPELLTC